MPAVCGPRALGIRTWPSEVMGFLRLLLFQVLLGPVMCFVHAPAVICSGGHDLRSTHVSVVTETQTTGDLRERRTLPTFVAVLRDVQSARADEVARVLYEEGFRHLSVTADTPEFSTIIQSISRQGLPNLILGASSVTTATQVDTACGCDAAFISSTCCDPEVVRHVKDMGMVSVPGVSSPAEAALALQAGADILKVFPSKSVSTKDFREIVDSVPPTIPVLISGGVEPEQVGAYATSGASGFAVGRTLFEPETELSDLSAKARRFLDAAGRIRWPPHYGPFN
ncbi:unnamed protein product [Scytosiphon promiscuus]